MKLLHIHREILDLAAEASERPSMPPPLEIQEPVAALVEGGLLIVSDDKVSISPDGLAALEA